MAATDQREGMPNMERHRSCFYFFPSEKAEIIIKVFL